MIKNLIKIGSRNLMKNKAYSFINIFGLSIGLTSCMLISLYIYHEYSYDNYHKNANNIYQLGEIFDKGGEDQRKSGSVPAAMAVYMEQEFPEIKESARLLKLFRDDKTLISYQYPGGAEKSFYEEKGYLADPELFQVLTYNFIEGNPTTALTEPNTIVISEEIAQKLFGEGSALNKIIEISSSTNGDHDFRITGVFRPNAAPSHIDARFFLSIRGGNLESWVLESTTLLNNNMFYTYLLLEEGTEPLQLQNKFSSFVDRHMREELNKMDTDRELFLTNIEDIHLRSDIENITPAGNITYLRILGFIAVLILVIACINFMNMSTARSVKRSVEVGVRKVLGAEKKILVWQFLGESFIMVLIAFIFSIIFTFALLPVFEQVTGREIILSFQQYGTLLIGFIVLAVCTGFLAAGYPAFYLSSFQPARVLKGRVVANSKNIISLRKGLVVFQFIISIALIIASLIIANQMDFLQSQDLGFKKEQQIIIPLRSTTAKNAYPALKINLQKNAGIKSVGSASTYPGIENPTDWLMYKEGDNMESSRTVHINRIDDAFLQTLDIPIVAGRSFSSQTDTIPTIILNEKGVPEMGFKSAEEAVGSWVGFDWEGQQFRFEIVGIVKDFHFKDLHSQIASYGFVFTRNPASYNYAVVSITGGDMNYMVSTLEGAWTELNPDEPFEYSFLDQDFQRNYESENRLAGIIGYFTAVAIFISCLGLFALAAYNAEQRIKEIGVRKVLGATVFNIVTLLSIDYLKLVILAIVLASPIAWYVMQKWLDTFAYRTSISWEIFAITSLVAIIIAVLTVNFQAVKTALVNPVNVLKSE